MSQENNDTRQQIINASLDLFAAKGFSGTSMREIAEQVGIRKSSIYNHFSSKSDLIETLLDKFGPSSIFNAYREFLNHSGKIEDPYLVLKKMGNDLYQLITKPEEQKFLRILVREHTNKMVREVLKRHLYNDKRALLIGFFEKLIKKGFIKQGDPVVYANEFTGPLIYFRMMEIILYYDGEEFVDLKDYIDNHIDFFWNAVKVE
ncbi:MAG: TetR/AcrR family transcriptional regulator [bacterium]